MTDGEFNFIVDNGNNRKEDGRLFFAGDTEESIQLIPPTTTMFDILVKCGIFKSKSDARKNWKKTGEAIPRGFSDFVALGKLKKRITILNAIKEDDTLTKEELELCKKHKY